MRTPGQLPIGRSPVFGQRLNEWPVGVLQGDGRSVDGRHGPHRGPQPIDFIRTEIAGPRGGSRPTIEQVQQAVRLKSDHLPAEGKLAE